MESVCEDVVEKNLPIFTDREVEKTILTKPSKSDDIAKISKPPDFRKQGGSVY